MSNTAKSSGGLEGLVNSFWQNPTKHTFNAGLGATTALASYAPIAESPSLYSAISSVAALDPTLTAAAIAGVIGLGTYAASHYLKLGDAFSYTLHKAADLANAIKQYGHKGIASVGGEIAGTASKLNSVAYNGNKKTYGLGEAIGKFIGGAWGRPYRA